MAKIINDSLLPSAPNAPLDARTEVNLLADVAKIENPSESLIFKVKETGKYYKVVSLKEVTIEGTTHKKKVIKEYEPFSDLEDAPKDGYKYVRMNGVWVRHEVDLDPTLPILTVNIKSNQGVDPIIDSLKCVAKYGSNEIELSSGEQINVPYGVNLTIEFPEVDEYNKPDNITVQDVASNMTYDVEYTYLMERVTVNVSAEDNSEVDGQEVTVYNIEKGIYIEDTEGYIYTKEEWDGTKTANSIVLLLEKFSARLGLTYPTQSPSTSFAYNARQRIYSTEDAARNDYDYEFGMKIQSSIGSNAIIDMFNTKTPNGQSFNIAATLGMLVDIQENKGYIDELIDIVGGRKPFDGGNLISITCADASSPFSKYWQISRNGSITNSVGSYYMLYLATITDEYPIKRNEKKYTVNNGKIEFKAEHGKSYTVSINSKEGDYAKSEPVAFTAGQAQRTINLKYIPLLIDTIYINNYIADTEAIVTGDMNGKALQAIWDEGKRHLGKYITKEDGTKEMVLIKVDENDSRYFEDGTPIDIEGLGTTAYYFTKIAAMSYKITQMSENVYKIQICYKYKPDETWKFFDETWVPIGINSYDNDRYDNGVPKIGEIEQFNDKLDRELPSSGDDFEFMGLFDYSNILLFALAKYGADYMLAPIDNIEVDANSSGITVNGDTLKYGNKDTISKRGSTILSLNILGIENAIAMVQAYIYLDKLECVKDTSSISTITIAQIHKNNYKIYKYDDTALKSSNKNIIASRFIDDYFTLFPKKVVQTEGVYYKRVFSLSNIIQSGSGKRLYLYNYGGCLFDTGDSKFLYTNVRVKYTGAYRIETDREKFNELTNTWV